LEGDGVTEGFESLDVMAGGLLGVLSSGVVVGSEVVEGCFWVVE
jgi:hypothetical protein